MDGGEHHRAKEETCENKDISIVGRDDMGQLQRHKSAREQGNGPGLGRNGGVVRPGASIHSVVGRLEFAREWPHTESGPLALRDGSLTLSFSRVFSLIWNTRFKRATMPICASPNACARCDEHGAGRSTSFPP